MVSSGFAGILFLVTLSVCQCQFTDLIGDYCKGRSPLECCPGRSDECRVPIFGTFCYCDIYCNRTLNSDCCPDFRLTCIRRPPPPTERCFRNGRTYHIGAIVKENCNVCTCRDLGNGVQRFYCDDSPCLIRPELIQKINSNTLGWKSANYSFLWGKTLDEGIRQRLGTYPPTRSTKNMPEIHIPSIGPLTANFDSRMKWAHWMQPIRDQGNCGSSWAFSSVDVASDRLAVMSGGLYRKLDLSPQLLVSCQSRGQDGCSGGHLDRAWWFLRKHGTSTDRCYPYESGRTSKAGPCKIKRLRRIGKKMPHIKCTDGREDILYLSTPPYRTAANEKAIMHEIYNNGPVQATFRVKEDFFSYRSGIYKYANLSLTDPPSYRKEGWHSIRIIGWGESSLGVRSSKYWLCANSWGSEWGEEGYFRILRGTNECDIESFVIGVWANLEEFDDKSVIDILRYRSKTALRQHGEVN